MVISSGTVEAADACSESSTELSSIGHSKMPGCNRPFFFGKHIYRLNAPLTAVDPVDPQIPSRLNPPGSISLWFYAVHRAYS